VDQYQNFAYSTIAVAPSPPTSGLSLTVAAGHGVRFPTPPFNAVVCAAGVLPVVTNAEIVRVTARATDTLTIQRTQEGSSVRAIQLGDQCFAAITKKVLDDLVVSGQAAHAPTHQPGGTDALTALDASVLTTGIVPDARLSANVARRDVANTFAVEQTFNAHTHFAPATAIYTGPTTAGDKLRLYVDDTFAILRCGGGAAIRVQKSDGNTIAAFNDNLVSELFGSIKERGRTVPMGEWIDIPFNAANYGAGTGTWVIGSQTNAAYMLCGKTMILSMYLQNTVISASTSNTSFLLPSGIIGGPNYQAGAIQYVGPVSGVGFGQVAPSQGILAFYRDTATTPFPSGNYTFIVNISIRIA
jgi:hypothetical protein